MWFDRLLSNPTTDALSYSVQFTEQRQRVLATNVANVDTPGFRAKSLSPRAFENALNEALQDAGSPAEPLRLAGSGSVYTDSAGRLVAVPIEEPANALFHDGTNARLEDLMSDAAGNALQHEFSINILRNRFDSLETATRGRLR